jgi:putative PIG3 family NAD(P)H quinone oxidoreductase
MSTPSPSSQCTPFLSSHLPEKMQCVEIIKPGPSGALELTQRPVPTPGKGEVLIKVAAAGINRPDIFQRQGLYPSPEGASDIPGLEVSGEIVSVGDSTTRWHSGQQVCALLTGGGYAEYALAHEDLCLPIPKPLNLIQAAALPETFFTVWHNIFECAALKLGEILLVHGGASGIGTTAIQLANAMGHRVFTTVSSNEKCQKCLTLGAKAAINYQAQDFVSEIKKLTNGHGADVILDMVGGDYVQRNIRAAAFRGRIISIAFLRGSKVDVDLMPMMLKQLVLTGSTLRSRPVEEKALIANALLDKVWPLLENSVDNGAQSRATKNRTTITPLISATFPMEQAASAHKLMESNQHIGKIVLTIQ